MADSYDRAKRPTRSWSRAGDENRFIVRCKHTAVNLFVTIRTFFFFACSSGRTAMVAQLSDDPREIGEN